MINTYRNLLFCDWYESSCFYSRPCFLAPYSCAKWAMLLYAVHGILDGAERTFQKRF